MSTSGAIQSITALEDTLGSARNTMNLGYTCPKTSKFVEKSSVGLRTTMKTSEVSRHAEVNI